MNTSKSFFIFITSLSPFGNYIIQYIIKFVNRFYKKYLNRGEKIFSPMGTNIFKRFTSLCFVLLCLQLGRLHYMFRCNCHRNIKTRLCFVNTHNTLHVHVLQLHLE
uniref:Uncharacterized protein n=1 Tax=Podoviridae sp. ctC8s18 TaxID=2827617 RepID=A0A8S5LQP3_9CAUD|nr:MAG TPA: hypothetical protein [Podoviridae sp. ctC8s18]